MVTPMALGPRHGPPRGGRRPTSGRAGGESRAGVNKYEFTLRVDRKISEDEAEALDRVLGAHSVMTSPGTTAIEFSREAPGWADAIGSAVRDVEGLGGLVVVGAGQEDLVSIAGIARRSRRSREAVRLWAAGRRGPGGFPPAEWQSPAGERFWSWAKVARWIRENMNLAVEGTPDEVRWADEILRARQAIAAAQRILDQDENMRREFGHLLAAPA